MATSFVSRSLRNLIVMVLVIGSLTTGCKKSGGSDPDVDPRDQYVGTYTGTYRNSIYLAEDMYDEPKAGTATATITKGSNPKEIYVEILTTGDRTGDRKIKVTAELADVNYTVIDKTTDVIPLPRPADSDYNATGVFDPNKKQFAYTSVARAVRNGLQIRQTYDIVGARQ